MRKRNIITLFMFSLLISSTTFSPIYTKMAHGQASPPGELGPYNVGWISINIPKNGGAALPAQIFYPSEIRGEGSNPNATNAPYPTLLFSLGYSSTIDYYLVFAFTVASWGFVFTLVGSAQQAWDLERATDLINALNWLDEQNDNSSFILSQMMDESKFGVLGHSLGGEAAIKASLSDSRLKVLISIAPFVMPPITVISPQSAADVHIPFLILVGSADSTSPPSTMSYPLYYNGNSPKFCITIIGANHFNIISTCAKYVVSFLKFYLYEDKEYARYLFGKEAQQENLDGKIDLKYDLRRIVQYEALFKGISYNISAYSDSDFLSFSFNESLNQMNFTLAGPPYTTGTANITIPAQIIGGYTVEVYFDGEPYPFTLSSNSESYFIYLSYNHTVHQLTIEFVDTTPPVLAMISPHENSILKSPNITVAWSGKDIASGLDYFEAKIDEETWIRVENATAVKIDGLSDGDHVAYVKAFDKAGNSEIISVSFKVDTTSPSVAIIAPAAFSLLNSPNVTVMWSGSDDVSGIDHYEVNLDNSSWINLGNATSYIFVNLTDASYMVSIKAVDKAGNPSETHISFTVKAKSNPNPLWMQWWFWAVIGMIASLLFASVVYIKKESRLSLTFANFFGSATCVFLLLIEKNFITLKR